MFKRAKHMDRPLTSGPRAAGLALQWRRLIQGIGANLLGKAWVIGGQLLCVPVLLSVWGPNGYGLWLIVTAIPNYVQLSDFGFGNTAAVQMARLVAVGEKTEALKVFQSVTLLVAAVLTVVLAASIAAFASFPLLARMLGVPSRPDLATAFVLLMIWAAAFMAMGALCTGYRSTGRYARGTFLLDLATPLEVAALLVAAVATRSYVVCAASLLAVRAPALVLYYLQLRRDEPWLRLGWTYASWAIVKPLAKPALATFALPLALSMSVQGVVFTVGISFGASAAGVLGAVRTFARLPLQLVAVITRASQQEMTIAYAKTDRRLITRIAALNLTTTIVTFGPFILISPWVGVFMHALTRGRLSVQASFYAALVVDAAVQAGWSTLAMFLFAENKLQKLVPWCLVAGAGAMTTPLLLRGHVTVIQLAWALCAFDLVVLAASARIWWRESGLTSGDFLHLATDLPKLVLNRLSTQEGRS